MQLQTLFYNVKNGWSGSLPSWDSNNTLIIVFAAPEFIDNQDPIQTLTKKFPNSHIVGCSSAGEIAGTHLFDHSITIAIVKFDKTPIKVVKTAITSSRDSFAAGKMIANKLYQKDLRGIFVLSDGLNVNGSELVKGLNTIQDGSIVITGGLAGDGNRFKQTWALFNGRIYQNHAIGVGFYGDYIQIGHGSRGGWDIFGPERRITRSSNNILYELDGKPALQLYKEYLGELSEGLPATGLLYPLAIRKSSNDPNHVVRTILSVDEAKQSLTFVGDMPQGYFARLMRANFDRLITAADEAGELATKGMSGIKKQESNVVLAIAISCVGRRLLLGERTEEETESTLGALPSGTQQIGFYSYGEISPYSTGKCDLHNQTMTLTTLYEG